MPVRALSGYEPMYVQRRSKNTLHLKNIGTVSPFDIQSGEAYERSDRIRERVMAAHEIQKERFRDLPIMFNSQMGNREIAKYCVLGSNERALMKTLAQKHDMSARTYYRVLRVARTIADLAGQRDITEEALMESIRMRSDF